MSFEQYVELLKGGCERFALCRVGVAHPRVAGLGDAAQRGQIEFVARPSRSARRAASLTGGEVAPLEVLDAGDTVIEVPAAEAAGLLAQWVAQRCRPAALRAAALTEPLAVQQRLTAMVSAATSPPPT